MLTAASGTGGARRPAPVHHAVTHVGRPAVHHAVFTAAYKSGPINPKIPAKYRPKAKPKPRPSVKFPTIGKLTTPKTAIAKPVTAPQKFGAVGIQKTAYRASIPHAPTGPVSPYVNPLRGISGLVPERIDQGVDYAGHGPIYALGPGKITTVGIGQGTGWAGAPEAGVNPGGYVGEQLSSGPGKGHVVYVAEGIYPTVHTGQTVTAKTVIANMVAPIETGYASGSGTQTLAATTGELSGPTSTGYGSAYSRLLHALGAPAGVPQDSGAAARYLSVPGSYSSTGGKSTVPTPSKGHISLPPAVPPISGVHGVNPPSTVPLGPITLTAARTTTRAAKPTRRMLTRIQTGGPPTTGGPTPVNPGGPVITTTKTKTTKKNVSTPIMSSIGTGQALGPVAAPSTTTPTGAASSSTTLWVLGGIAVVLLVVFLHKKGKKGSPRK